MTRRRLNRPVDFARVDFLVRGVEAAVDLGQSSVHYASPSGARIDEPSREEGGDRADEPEEEEAERVSGHAIGQPLRRMEVIGEQQRVEAGEKDHRRDARGEK